MFKVALFLAFGLCINASPVAQQNESEEGYELQIPPEIPSRIFPNRNVPTVPSIPQAQDDRRLYKTPRDTQEPENLYVTPRRREDVEGQTVPSRSGGDLGGRYATPRRDEELEATYVTPRKDEDLGRQYVTPRRDIDLGGEYAAPGRDENLVSQTLNGPQIKGNLYPDQRNNVPDERDYAQPSQMVGMPYDFQWGVNDEESNNIYNHEESSDGIITTGEYRVLLPDGRLQVVRFTDRGNGYEAEVSYEDYNKLL